MPRPGQPRGAAGTGAARVTISPALARRAAWIAWAILVLQQAADAWAGGAPWVVWVGVLLPLAIFIPGVLRDNLRSYIWLCFVSLLYFMRLVVDLFARPGDPLAVTGMVAVVVLFIAAMLYVRWRARELRALANAENES